DALVVPSRRTDDGNSDGIPNAVLEAFAAGTPVLAAPAGSIGEALGGGERGLVLAGGDERQRIAELATVLARFEPRAPAAEPRPPAVVARAEAAQRWVRRSFSGSGPLAPMIEVLTRAARRSAA